METSEMKVRCPRCARILPSHFFDVVRRTGRQRADQCMPCRRAAAERRAAREQGGAQ